MSNRLLNEVWAYTNPKLDAAALVLLLAVADKVRDEKVPEGRAPTNRGERVIKDDELCRMTNLNPDALRKAKGRLAKLGLEIRVQAKNPDGTPKFTGKGEPVFAYPGYTTRYKLPVLPFSGAGTASEADQVESPPQSINGHKHTSRGGNTVPPLGGADDAESAPMVGTQSAGGGNVVRQWRESVPTDSLEPPKTPSPVSTTLHIASLSPSVTRTHADEQREVIMIGLAKEHGVSAERLAEIAREHGATAEEFEGAWRMASKPDFPRADEYRDHFWDFFKAWIKEPGEVAKDIANYRDKVRCDVRDAEYAALGNCEFHQQPQPCHGCAADAKAARDEAWQDPQKATAAADRWRHHVDELRDGPERDRAMGQADAWEDRAAKLLAAQQTVSVPAGARPAAPPAEESQATARANARANQAASKHNGNGAPTESTSTPAPPSLPHANPEATRRREEAEQRRKADAQAKKMQARREQWVHLRGQGMSDPEGDRLFGDPSIPDPPPPFDMHTATATTPSDAEQEA